jgi:hypothetical protein
MHLVHIVIKQLREQGKTARQIAAELKATIDPTCSEGDVFEALRILGMNEMQDPWGNKKRKQRA